MIHAATDKAPDHPIRSAGWRTALVFGGGLLVLAALLFVSLIYGEADISLAQVVAALTDPQNDAAHHMIRGVRLPRAVMGLLAGAALAVCGALLQTITRNPLASASTFGLNAGAYFVIMAAAVFFPALKANAPLLLGFIGALGAAAMTYGIAGGKASTPVRMAVSGMIVGLVLSAFTSALQLFFEQQASQLLSWGAGSLVQNDWSGVQYAWPWIAAGLAFVLAYARGFDLLELGDEAARSLGQRVDAARFAGLAVSVLLAAVTVSVVGPIGFVGLIAPHLMRLMGIRRHLLLLPASALWGAVILVGADTVARMFRSSLGELPAGAVTAAIGAPWLIWLVIRARKGQASADSGSSMSVGATGTRVPYPVLVAGMLIVLVILMTAGLMAGTLKLSVVQIVQVVSGGGGEFERSIIMDLRLPRLLVAAFAGAALAVAGSMMQGALRNPIADPSVLGVTSGAGFGALAVMVLWPQASAAMLPAGAIAGAAAAALCVYAFSWRKGLQPVSLILVGIGVSAIGTAGIQFLVIKSGIAAAPALAWLAGSTYARGYDEWFRLAVVMAVLGPIAWWLGRRIDLLAFGDQTSLGLGLKLQRTRLLATVIGVALAATAASSVGSIGFIGLLAPHAVRVLVGQHHRRAVLLSAITGAVLLAAADLIGKTVMAPKEIPAGIVVALLGTPYLLMLMYRSAVRK
ncbi:iron complex transport system permease protein [Paenibacillus sp. UNCCL117]|uniref:iron ABC transporter permease n=1 Tax=unclassified Paenibacillus TaxID=185978 RepID=UPI000884547D|nr:MULTISPECIES: iron ABC transporter permease [unclassified Paenibacillus]SDD65113.1 iron complex transport system permease protein [Paenibacillus sp. cl123]SFW58189.1 iron complex transport system permease protein [Paenibacillus sp. UNCCL117]